MGVSTNDMVYVSSPTFIYTFVANYLVFVGLALVLWMAFCPILSLRRKPAQALNWLSRKVRLTKRFKFTTIITIMCLFAVAGEYFNMAHKQQGYIACKTAGRAIDNCQSQLGAKWRGERNFWLMAFNLFAWFIVGILSNDAAKEEEYSEFLSGEGSPHQSKDLSGAFAEFQAARAAGVPQKKNK